MKKKACGGFVKKDQQGGWLSKPSLIQSTGKVPNFKAPISDNYIQDTVRRSDLERFLNTGIMDPIPDNGLESETSKYIKPPLNKGLNPQNPNKKSKINPYQNYKQY